METRNAVFKDALMSLQDRYPDAEESKLADDILENLPIHFDAFGAKPIHSVLNEQTMNAHGAKRALEKACHGFPLHLPGHIQPCREDDKIECNEMDEKIRRFVNKEDLYLFRSRI